MVGIALALIVGKAVDFKGNAEGKLLGMKLEVSGPVVAWLLVVGVGMTYELAFASDSAHTFAFVAPGGSTIPVTGQLTVSCDQNYSQAVDVRHASSVTIQHFPAWCHSAPVTIRLESNEVALQKFEASTAPGKTTEIAVSPQTQTRVYSVFVADHFSIPVGTHIAIDGADGCEDDPDHAGNFFIECPALRTRKESPTASFLLPVGSRFRCTGFPLKDVDELTRVSFEAQCQSLGPDEKNDDLPPSRPPAALPAPTRSLQPASTEDCEIARSWVQRKLEPEVGGNTTGSINYLVDKAVGVRGDGQTATYVLASSSKVSLAKCTNTRLFD